MRRILPQAATLKISHLLRGYKRHQFTPSLIMQQVIERIEKTVASNDLLQRAQELENAFSSANLATDADFDSFFAHTYPLYGIPFAVKDNIDVANVATTAGCPGYAYTASESADCVQRVLDSGGIFVGKCNLDQFATGLNGTRSPFGTPVNRFDASLIPGGSSSGSAAAVAHDFVSFAFGTDTAGSGRVPAAMNGVYGIKPSFDMISTRGVVPACKSLDCVSLLTHNISDAFAVYEAVRDNTAKELCHSLSSDGMKTFEFAIPKGILDEANIDRFFCGDRVYFESFKQTVTQTMTAKGGHYTEIDFEPFFKVARMLYDGPWVAERLCALPFMSDENQCRQMEGLDATVHQIVSSAQNISAQRCFDAFYKLNDYKSELETVLQQFDFVCVPTIPTTYTVQEMKKEPLQLNSNLGLYTNFVNLLNLCAVAMPTSTALTCDGRRPFGVTLIGEYGMDYNLMLRSLQINGDNDEDAETARLWSEHASQYQLCVCGAHMSDGRLNHELTSRGAKLNRKVKSRKNQYEMYSLDGGQRPGMLEVKNDKGVEIEMEIWCFREARQYGDFIAKCVTKPLCVGTLLLSDDTQCKGFLMESSAVKTEIDTPNITSFGGWSRFKRRLSKL